MPATPAELCGVFLYHHRYLERVLFIEDQTGGVWDAAKFKGHAKRGTGGFWVAIDAAEMVWAFVCFHEYPHVLRVQNMAGLHGAARAALWARLKEYAERNGKEIAWDCLGGPVEDKA